MSLTEVDFLSGLRGSRVLVVVRGKCADAAAKTALTLFDEGIRFVEVALTTPSAPDVIARVAAAKPDGAVLGAGTVCTVDDVAAVEAAGAEFVVTPAVLPSIAAAARRGIPVAAGALTPTEVVAARDAGAAVVKLFPASLGGPGYLRALRDPFPDIPLMAVGGVGIGQARAYFDVGALAIGVGGPLVGDAADGGDLAALRERARAYAALAGPVP